MGQLHTKVISALKDRFADIVDGLETVNSTDRVTGWIASRGFNGLEDSQRQDLLWELLEHSLTSEELSRVGPIVTLTPSEVEIDVRLDH